MGGENMAFTQRVRPSSGSSPRGRGKHARVSRVHRSFRLIPAWAGKTFGALLRPFPRRAHPRVGGENDAAPASRRSGSRLIPAWAGKTYVSK